MLFNNNDWKLSVTDINLYDNTVSLDGQSYPLSLAIKTLIPGYLSGLPSTSRESMELLEALAEAGVAIGNFFSNDLMTAYGRRQLNKRAEAERIAKEQRIQADRMREENMTDEEWQKSYSAANRSKLSAGPMVSTSAVLPIPLVAPVPLWSLTLSPRTTGWTASKTQTHKWS